VHTLHGLTPKDLVHAMNTLRRKVSLVSLFRSESSLIKLSRYSIDCDKTRLFNTSVQTFTVCTLDCYLLRPYCLFT
jgi:hypothetical protein